MRIYIIENDHKFHKVPDGILEHVSEYKDEERRNVSSLCWNFLSIALADDFGTHLDDEEILINNLGKPYLKSNKIFFNISHSHDLCAIIVAEHNCGIDIEKKIKDKNLSKKILSKFEQFVYAISPCKLSYLTKVWVKKEALAKKSGVSVSSLFKDTVMFVNCKKIRFNKETYYYAFA